MENDSLIGTQLGAYRIQDKLGEGGMAEVYKAYDPRLQRDVAIKVVLPQIAEQGGFRQRFEQEIRLSAQLEHHNIVRVYDVGQSGNLTYLVMQYVGGGTLRDQLRGGRPLEPRKAAQYALQMARALHHAHMHGIIHRDVKPQNMLISASDPNELLLSDFGIAKLFDVSREETIIPLTAGSVAPRFNVGDSQGLTNAGQMIGTAEYMAPEQINLQPVDARTDVYALGVVLFQMLTGQVPFQSSSALGLLYQHIHTVPLSVRELNPIVPEMLARITAKALAKAPEARFQSTEEMAQALEAVLSPSVSGAFSAGTREDYSTVPRPSATLPADIAPPPPGSSYYGQQSIPSAVSTGGSGLRSTAASRVSGGSLVAPALPPTRSKIPLSYIMVAIVTVLVVVFGIWHPSITGLLGGTGTGSTLQAVSTFTDNFHDNHLNWLAGSYDGGNLTISPPSNNQYVLTIGNVNSTYFPHPDPGAVKPLPNNFTMTAQIMQNTGGTTVFYGIAFYMSLQADGVSMQHCYALVIDGNGDYQVLKYDINAPTVATMLWRGNSLSAIHRGLNQSNTLQAIVQGNTFSFKVNGMPVPLSGGNQSITDSSSPYTGGQLALLVAGPNTSFTATQVQLAIP